MTARTDAQDALTALRLRPPRLLAYLDENSGLPGPRANLTLVEAFADVAPAEFVLQLSGSPDEFRRLCAAAALGRLYLEAAGAERAAVEGRMRERAEDGSRRVREGVAMALQRIGDAEPETLAALVAAWLDAPSLLVLRAACAGVCEPRLLRHPALAAAALDACRRSTDRLEGLPFDARHAEGLRELRQALGYCWSVAVAGAPGPGLAAWAQLRGRAAGDGELTWIVRENEGIARLRRLLTR